TKQEINRKKRPWTAREAAEIFGVNQRTIRSWNAMKREDWIDEQATMRESIRAYHDDEGHSWRATADHFSMSTDAVRARAYRARKERKAEAEANRLAGEVPLF
ncbi:replication protein RepB, partial [Bifidobacterium lemurum]